jgi:exonuclease III
VLKIALDEAYIAQNYFPGGNEDRHEQDAKYRYNVILRGFRVTTDAVKEQ